MPTHFSISKYELDKEITRLREAGNTVDFVLPEVLVYPPNHRHVQPTYMLVETYLIIFHANR